MQSQSPTNSYVPDSCVCLLRKGERTWVLQQYWPLRRGGSGYAEIAATWDGEVAPATLGATAIEQIGRYFVADEKNPGPREPALYTAAGGEDQLEPFIRGLKRVIVEHSKDSHEWVLEGSIGRAREKLESVKGSSMRLADSGGPETLGRAIEKMFATLDRASRR